MDIRNVYDAVIFTSAALSIKDAVVEAVKQSKSLRGANLRGANLQGANLRGANLQGANLRGADLQDANLQDADLQGADLQGADLRGANLRDANLRGANLQGADLQGADLRGANLQGANLRGADLQDANLQDADLQGADLQGANLRGANLQDADLQDANLRGANLQDANLQGALNAETALAMIQFLPETGSFEGWKKCSGGIIVKLLIPEDAKRSHGSERKARASKATVLEIFGAEEARSGGGYETVIYRKGETVQPDGWDEDRWNVCSHGIHFFLTRIEAEEYQL